MYQLTIKKVKEFSIDNSNYNILNVRLFRTFQEAFAIAKDEISYEYLKNINISVKDEIFEYKHGLTHFFETIDIKKINNDKEIQTYVILSKKQENRYPKNEIERKIISSSPNFKKLSKELDEKIFDFKLKNIINTSENQKMIIINDKNYIQTLIIKKVVLNGDGEYIFVDECDYPKNLVIKMKKFVINELKKDIIRNEMNITKIKDEINELEEYFNIDKYIDKYKKTPLDF